MKIYVAGKITGDKNFTQKFAKVQTNLESQGHVVLNPAIIPKGFSQAEYMRICLAMIDCVDSVFMLSDWKESEGACVEEAYAKKIGKTVIYQSREE